MENLKRLIAGIIVISQILWSINGYADVGDFKNINTVSGAGTIDRSPVNGITLTQTTPKWHTTSDTLSLGADETLTVNQPSSSSVYLDTVTGGSPSQILGTINANGLVFLINQNGILFAPGAQVNVGGLIASTLDITDAQFQTAHYYSVVNSTPISVNGYYFTGASGFGSVINQGAININGPGGYVALLGSNVENTGSIMTSEGSVVLASGNAIAVNLDNSGSVSAVVVPTGLDNNASGNVNAVFNSGTLTANGGNVFLTAQSLKGLFTNLINNSGIIEAKGILIDANDHVLLTGTLTAGTGDLLSSGTGGVSIIGGNIDIDYATVTSTALNDKSLIEIQFDGGINIINSKLLSTSNMTLSSPSSFAGLYIQGNGVINIVNSQLRAVLNNTISGSTNTLMTIGSDLDINSYLNDAPQSGVIVNNSQLESSVNGASAQSINSITAQTNSNILNGNIQFINGSTVQVNQAGTGYENLTISGENISDDAASHISADTLTLVSITGIGDNNAINTTANTIDADVSLGGSINLNNTNTLATGVTLDDLTNVNGSITVTADGGINANDVNTATNDSIGNNISLTASNGNINVGNITAGGTYALANLTATNGSILNSSTSSLVIGNVVSLKSANGIGLPGPVAGKALITVANIIDADVTGTGLINLKNIYTNPSAGVTLADLTTANGSITVNADGNINVTTVNAGSDNVTLKTILGSILDANSSVSGNVVSLTGVDGVGTSTTAINTTANTLDASASAGLININQTGNVVLGSIATGGTLANSITVTGSGSIDVGTVSADGGLADVNLFSSAGMTDNTGGVITANNLNLTANNNIGSSTNPVNINANYVAAISQGIGNIYLNSQNAVTLSNMLANNGLINIISDGQITADDVTTNGSASNSISLTTTFGDIDVGNINAAGGLGDVTLNAAGNIYAINSSSLITGNNLSLTSGITSSSPVGELLTSVNGVTTSASGGSQMVTIKNQPGATSYNIYFLAYNTANLQPIGAWQLVASIPASNGSKTVWIDPSIPLTGQLASYQVVVGPLAQTSNIGTSTNPVNTNVNTITGIAQNIGNIYLNSISPVTLSNLYATDGLINVNAAGGIITENVATGGGASDSITFNTSSGNIDLGKINAAGGLGDVTVNSVGSITDNSGQGLITANNFNFSSGNLVGTEASTTIEAFASGTVLTIRNSNSVNMYNIYYVTNSANPTWNLVATIQPTRGATTVWNAPTQTGVVGYYAVINASVTSTGVGSASNPINTNANTITGLTNAGPFDDIYLNSTIPVDLSSLSTEDGLINVDASGPITVDTVTTGGDSTDSITLQANSGDITVNSINSAGDVYLNSVNGSILGTGVATNVTSSGDTHLTAGNLIGSWNPNIPLSVNVGKDLYLSIAKRDSLATGSVGSMPVSGTLSGTVAGAYHFAPGTHDVYDATHTVFNGNPPGYIFLNNNEIWPNLSLPPIPAVLNLNQALANSQVANLLQPNQTVYYEKQSRHLIRQIEVAAPLAIYAYHSLVDNNSSAIDNIKLEPEAYDFIDKSININTTISPILQGEGQK